MAETAERGRRPAGPTRAEVVEGVAGELAAAGLPSPRVEAERLVASVLGVERARLQTHGTERLSPAQAADIARAVSRRMAGEPLQHLEGTVDFRTLTLVSDPRALIPRPETEHLIDVVAARIGGGPAPRALEIGVGSGAISLALLSEGLADVVVALDVSASALEQAAENARAAGLDDRLDLRRCRPAVWPDLEGERPFDLIVSNPPYIRSRDIDELQVEVRDHEPRVALDGGDDGLDVVRAIIAGAPEALVAEGRLFLEIGSDQGDAVSRLFAADPRWRDPEIVADLTGRPRYAIAVRAGNDGVSPVASGGASGYTARR